MPMLFAPTIEAALLTKHWYLWACCPACRTTGCVDLRRLDRHRQTTLTGLIPALSCRSCRPNAQFAEILCVSKMSIEQPLRDERASLQRS
jgi:hypothetical protein